MPCSGCCACSPGRPTRRLSRRYCSLQERRALPRAGSTASPRNSSTSATQPPPKAAWPRRTKLVYAATPAVTGVPAVAGEPSAPPQFESEAMVKFFFCDHGTLEDGACRALEEFRAHGGGAAGGASVINEVHPGRLRTIFRTPAHRHADGALRVRVRHRPRPLGGMGPAARRRMARHRTGSRSLGREGAARERPIERTCDREHTDPPVRQTSPPETTRQPAQNS